MNATELVLLHALPLDGSMWSAQSDLLPGRTQCPTLYGLGSTVDEWASEVLSRVQGDRLIVVGNSVGGSCALEMAAAAPERVVALVLIGVKAALRPEPDAHMRALQALQHEGIASVWDESWASLFAQSTDRQIVEDAKQLALHQAVDDIARGVTAFHTRINREALLPKLSQPTVFVTGEHDVAPGLGMMQWQAEQCQNSRLHVIADCGHYVPLEKPRELNGILRSVIEMVDCASNSK